MNPNISCGFNFIPWRALRLIYVIGDQDLNFLFPSLFPIHSPTCAPAVTLVHSDFLSGTICWKIAICLLCFYAIFQYSPSCHFTDIFKANSGIWHRLCHLYRFINPRVTSCKFTEWWHWTELCKMNLFPQPLNWLIRLKTQFKGITLTPLGRKSSKLSSPCLGIATQWWTNEVLVYWPETKPPTLRCSAVLAVIVGLLTPRAVMTPATPSGIINTTTFVKFSKDFLFTTYGNVFVLWLGRENSLALHHRILLDIFQFTPWSKRFVKD